MQLLKFLQDHLVFSCSIPGSLKLTPFTLYLNFGSALTTTPASAPAGAKGAINCQVQPQLQVKLSLKAELALFSFPPATRPPATRPPPIRNSSDLSSKAFQTLYDYSRSQVFGKLEFRRATRALF